MEDKELIKLLAEKGYEVTKKKKSKHFEQALISLFALSIFFTIIAVIFTCCGYNADWPFYAADSSLSSLITLITVRVIQRNRNS